MLLEVSRLVLGDEVVQRPRHEREEAVVFGRDGVGEDAVFQRHEVLEVDVERREIVDPEAVDLRNVVLVAGHGAGRGCPGGCGVFDISILFMSQPTLSPLIDETSSTYDSKNSSNRN